MPTPACTDRAACPLAHMPGGHHVLLYNDDIPHQIRLAHNSQYSGGLGVVVQCSCHPSLVLGGTCIVSEADAWQRYNKHVAEASNG